MELPLSYVLNASAEIAAANRPNWRLFRVPHVEAATPQDDMYVSSRFRHVHHTTGYRLF